MAGMWSIVLIADTIKRHRKTLQTLLGLDMEMEELPTAAEVIAERDASISKLGERNEELQVELTKVKDKERKQADRLKTAGQRKTEAVRAAREKAQAAAKEKIAAFREKEKERQAKAAQLRAEGLEAAYADDYASALAKVAKARARARKVETEAKAARQRLKRAQSAEATVKELREQLDEAMQVEEPPESPGGSGDEPAPKSARRDEHDRFTSLDWKLRELILAEEARRTPPIAIAANITDVLRMFAEEEVVPLPCVREIERMRHELTVVGECLAAFRVAICKRIISFGFDESTKFGLGLLSSNTQIEEAGGTSVDVVLWGASLTAGGTSEEVAKSVDVKIFSHARRLSSPAGRRSMRRSLAPAAGPPTAGRTPRRSASTAWPRRR